MSLTYYIFTAWNLRDDFRSYCDNGNGKPYGQYRVGNIAADDPFCDKSQEENVHQIHAEGEFGKAVNPSGSLLDAAEQQEGAEGGK